MQIETQNLYLKPLTIEQIKKFALNDGSLERELGLYDSPRTVPENLQQSLKERIIPNMEDDTKNPLFYTIWIAVSKSDNKMVASICFKGEANDKGESEIGAGTHGPHERKGYMTEVVNGIIQWAKEEGSLKAVTAETSKTNTASIRVLQKNGFIKYNETEESFWWRREL